MSETSESVPERVLEQLDGLDTADLRAVRDYVDVRLTSTRASVAETLLAQSSDPSRITVETDRTGSALLKKRHRCFEDGRDASQVASLYRVTREQSPTGEPSLHWTFLGDVIETCDDS
jgi:hypothetical protein